MSPKLILLLALVGFTLFYLGLWWAAWKEKGVRLTAPTPLQALIGFVTNFFDTLGIGSFATTTTVFRKPAMLIVVALLAAFGTFALPSGSGARLGVAALVLVTVVGLLVHGLRSGPVSSWPSIVEDRVIPGTLNVGHTLPTILQAFIYMTAFDLDFTTLVALIAAAVLGAWLGAGIVSSWNAQKVRIGMGFALLAAAGFFVYKALIGNPAEVGTQGLTGVRLVLGVAGNFVLGALMSLGIGLYAPCMILVSLLGMNYKLAFPIMMGSCAFLMPVGSAAFVRAGAFDTRAALGLAIGGLPAVWIAAKIVKDLDIQYVLWLVIVVVIYTALTMLYSAFKGRPAA